MSSSRPPGPGGAVASAEAAGERPGVLWVLGVLTVVSGVVDAVSFVGLGRVFTANMTGNVVILGFAAARVPGYSASLSALSLAGFLLGALVVGRLAAGRAGRPGRWFAGALLCEACGLGVAALLGLAGGVGPDTWGRYGAIALMAVAMGCRNAAVRHLAVPDFTTTVLTLTLTGLAADSRPAGGNAPRTGRRIVAPTLMFLGACGGALLLRATDPSACLGVLTAVLLVLTVGWRRYVTSTRA